MINVRKDTFGGTPAAFKLAEILSEIGDTKLISKVSRKLISFNRILSELTKVDTSVSVGLAKLTHTAYTSEVVLSGCIPMNEKVKTFVNNLITMRFRVWMKENRGHMPRKNRIKMLS